MEIGKVFSAFFRWPNQNSVLLWKRKVACQQGRAGIQSQVFWIQASYPFSGTHKLHRSVWIPSFVAAEMLMILTYSIPNRTRKGGGSLIVDAILERVESSWGQMWTRITDCFLEPYKLWRGPRCIHLEGPIKTIPQEVHVNVILTMFLLPEWKECCAICYQLEMAAWWRALINPCVVIFGSR